MLGKAETGINHFGAALHRSNQIVAIFLSAIMLVTSMSKITSRQVDERTLRPMAFKSQARTQSLYRSLSACPMGRQHMRRNLGDLQRIFAEVSQVASKASRVLVSLCKPV